jgi:NADH:ubiquinone oxidoreductase subunit K
MSPNSTESGVKASEAFALQVGAAEAVVGLAVFVGALALAS